MSKLSYNCVGSYQGIHFSLAPPECVRAPWGQGEGGGLVLPGETRSGGAAESKFGAEK